MSTKVLKYISVCLLVLAFGAFGTGVAQAALTANATALTSDGVLTLTGAAASTWSLSTGALTINAGTNAALTLDSGGTGAVDIATGGAAKVITIGNVSGATSLALTTGTGGIDISSTIATADALDVAAASLTSGDLFDIDAAAITAGDFFDITVPTTRTGGTAFLITDNSVAAAVTAPLIDINVEGTTDTNTLDITFATLIATGNAIDLNMGTNVAGDALNIGGAATTGDAIEIVPGTARTSGSAILITDASIAATVTGDLVQIDVTGTPDTNTIDIDVTGIATATSNALDITYATAVALGNAIDLNMGTNVAGDALNIGGAATTGDAIEITPGTARTAGSAIKITDASVAATVTDALVQIDVTGTPDTNTIDIDVTGIVEATSNALDITYATAAGLGNAVDLNMGTNVAGDALNIGGAATTGDAIEIVPGTARTSGSAILVTDASIAATVTGDLIQINVTGTPDTNTIDIDITGVVEATSNALDITYATGVALGNAIDLNMGTNVAGDALNIGGAATTGDAIQIVPGTARTSGTAILITDDSLAAAVTGPLVDINVEGTTDTNTLDITFATLIATGNAIDLNMGTNVAGDALNIGGAATTGDAIEIVPGTARTSGSAILITDASIAATVTGDLVQIDVTGTPDTNTIDIDVTGIATATSNALDITYATAVALGNAIDLNMGTNVAGDALNIGGAATTGDAIEIVPGTARTSGSAIKITDASVAATVTDALVQIDVTGTPDTNTIDIDVTGIVEATSNAIDVTYATAAGLGNAVDLNMGTNVAGDGLNIASTSATGNAVQIDAVTTLVTSGVLDINIDAGNALVDGINLAFTVNDLATAAADFEAMVVTLTANDADADVFGIRVTATDTANAAAGSYEAAITIDNADTTTLSMTDGILITSSGVDTGITDGIDVSASNITNAINVGVNPIVTGNVAGTIGDATTDSWTFTVDGTGTGEIVLPTDAVSAGEIVDVARAINLGLSEFIDCDTNAGALIGFDTTADALPDYVNSATDGLGFVLRFDDTGATEDQNSSVCANLTVPPDYASGGEFRIRALKDAHAGATEVLSCAVSIIGAALGAAGDVTTSALASTTYTCTPAGTYAANDSVSFTFQVTSGTTMDDTVDVASVEFVYTSTE